MTSKCINTFITFDRNINFNKPVPKNELYTVYAMQIMHSYLNFIHFYFNILY